LAFGQAFFILIFIINKRYLIKFMSEFKFPTEMVELPSKGLPYPESNPLSAGKLEMKYMTAKEEDILTNQSYIQQGVVLDKLLQSLIVTKIDYNDLLVGDKNAILIAARILGYGKDYAITYKGEEVTVDVTFPAEYHAENLKGKAAKFAVAVKAVEAQQLPEVNDEFAKLFGLAEATVDALKVEVKHNSANTVRYSLNTFATETRI
jgi:hypothetical protein